MPRGKRSGSSNSLKKVNEDEVKNDLQLLVLNEDEVNNEKKNDMNNDKTNDERNDGEDASLHTMSPEVSLEVSAVSSVLAHDISNFTPSEIDSFLKKVNMGTEDASLECLQCKFKESDILRLERT